MGACLSQANSKNRSNSLPTVINAEQNNDKVSMAALKPGQSRKIELIHNPQQKNSSTTLTSNPGQRNTDDIYIAEVMCGSDQLYQVKETEMSQRLHRFMVAIVWKITKHNLPVVGRGSGILISPNLILTCAHNFFCQNQRIQNQHVELYVGQSGKLQNPHKIQKLFIPNQYDPSSMPTIQLNRHDYALIKISRRVKGQNFIGLGVNRQLKMQKLAVFGYPGCKYQNIDKITNDQTVTQWGLIKDNAFFSVRQESELLHCVSTLPGHSGSPVIWVQEIRQQKFTIIGIHKAGIKTYLNGSWLEVNAGKLLTEQLIVVLLAESIKMKADRFVVNNRAEIAELLVNKGDELFRKDSSQYIKVIEYYLSALKIYPDYLINKRLRPFIDKLNDDRLLINYYKNQLVKDKFCYDAQFLLGLLFEKTGDKSEQYQNKLRAVRNIEEVEIGLIELANYHFKQKEYEQAIKYYRKAIKINPQYATAHSNLGLALKAMRKYEEAIESYRVAIKINPQAAEVHNRLGNVLYEIDKIQEAIQCYLKAVEINPRYQNAQRNLENPKKAQTQKQQALMNPEYSAASNGSQHRKEANNEKREIVEKNEEAVEDIVPGTSQAYCIFGLASAQAKKTQQAIQWYRKAIKLDPKNKFAYIQLGNSLYSLNKPYEAIECYRKQIQLNPQHAQSYNNLGLVLQSINKKQEAVECWHKAIKINPKNSSSYYSLGKYFYFLNQNQEAIEHFRKSIQLNPKYSDAYNGLGGVFAQMKRHQQAIEQYRKAIELNPKNAFAYYNLGNTFRDIKKIEEAVECYRKSITFNPNYADTHDNLGLALIATNKAEAMECFRKAISINPRHSNAYTHLGLAYQQQNSEEAMKCYRKATQLDNNNFLAKTLLKITVAASRQQNNVPPGFEQYLQGNS